MSPVVIYANEYQLFSHEKKKHQWKSSQYQLPGTQVHRCTCGGIARAIMFITEATMTRIIHQPVKKITSLYFLKSCPKTIVVFLCIDIDQYREFSSLVHSSIPVDAGRDPKETFKLRVQGVSAVTTLNR